MFPSAQSEAHCLQEQSHDPRCLTVSGGSWPSRSAGQRRTDWIPSESDTANITQEFSQNLSGSYKETYLFPAQGLPGKDGPPGRQGPSGTIVSDFYLLTAVTV